MDLLDSKVDAELGVAFYVGRALDPADSPVRRGDFEVARIPVRTDEGVVGFRAPRHTTGALLACAGR